MNIKIARVFILCIVITGQVSCRHHHERNVDTDRILNGLSVSKDSVDTDTLTGDQFLGAFDETVLLKYDIDSDRNLAMRMEDSNVWLHKKLLTSTRLIDIPVWGQPLSRKEINDSVTCVITATEQENQIVVRLFTLTQHFELIDHLVLTSAGGDEGVGSRCIGEFINDSTYVRTDFQTIYDSDSVFTEGSSLFILHADGKIEETRTLSH